MAQNALPIKGSKESTDIQTQTDRRTCVHMCVHARTHARTETKYALEEYLLAGV